MLQSLWIDYPPKIGGRGAVTPLRIKGSIEKAYTVAVRGAASHNAAAADRAAADPFLGLPQRTPQEFSIRDDPDEARGDDMLDALFSRMTGREAAQPQERPTGNERPTVNGSRNSDKRAAPVPPSLARAARRLVEVGVPDLRKPRVGVVLANNTLKSKVTFTDWVLAQKALKMPQLREAETIARSLDLATHQYGVAFLASDPAEVMLRRMYALVLGCRAGTMAMAEMLEELPGDHTVADMPDELIDELEKKLCVRRKIEYNAELAKS